MKVNLQLQRGVVMLTTTLPDGRFRYSTGVHITPEVFNKGKIRAFSDLDKQKAGAVIKLQNEAISCLLRGVKTCRELRGELDLITEKRRRHGTLLYEFAVHWTEGYKETHPKGTYKAFNTLNNHLKKFPIDLKDVDHAFYERFHAYLLNEGYSKNFIHQMISRLRRILREAEYLGKWSGNTSRMRAGAEEVYNIYLTQDELDRIYKKELPEVYQNAAYQFLIGCYTGLRYEDFVRVKNVGDYITIDTLKTGQRVTIPTHPVVKEIMTKKVHAISNAKLNLYIKEVARICDIDTPVTRTVTRGGVRVEETKQKWEMVQTHTARRTFATLCYLGGIPPEIIMRVTGHKSIRQFMGYLKITEEDTARILKDHPFFNGASR